MPGPKTAKPFGGAKLNLHRSGGLPFAHDNPRVFHHGPPRLTYPRIRLLLRLRSGSFIAGDALLLAIHKAQCRRMTWAAAMRSNSRLAASSGSAPNSCAGRGTLTTCKSSGDPTHANCPTIPLKAPRRGGTLEVVPHNHTILAALAFLISLFLGPLPCCAQELAPYLYNIGTPQLTDLFVDPQNGSDARSGDSRASALRTVSEAWRRIPSSQELSSGYRISLLPGTYGDEPGETPSYWELKRGTHAAPIIFQAANGQGTVTFTADINMANVSYFYLLNISIKRGGDTFHCEGCDHILLRGNTLIGAPRGRNVGDVAHETIKFNQSQHVYLESNLIRGAGDNAIDWVAVQYGHIVGNSISDAQSWCAYVKGGSAYIRIEGNELFNCFEGGVTAGQGTGLEYMTGPWFRYEAYDIKIINNVIHDIAGAALGVNGGRNILLAHNTAYRIGSRSHLVEVVFGSRSCDESASRCLSRVSAGAWGPSTIGGESGEPIGNHGVKVLNNVLYNPAGFPLGDQHFAIYGPQVPTVPGIPNPQRSDIGLEIKGNVIWNGSASHPLGIEDSSQGCQPANPTCNEAQLRADNFINTAEPELVNPARGDFRPRAGSNILALTPAGLPAFPPRSGDENTPEGVLQNRFTRDRSGLQRATLPIGAYASASSRILPPADSGSPLPKDPSPPKISSLSAKYVPVAGRHRISVSFIVSAANSLASVSARLSNGRSILLRRRDSRYSGSITVRTAAQLSVTVTAADKKGLRAQRTVTVRAGSS